MNGCALPVDPCSFLDYSLNELRVVVRGTAVVMQISAWKQCSGDIVNPLVDVVDSACLCVHEWWVDRT